MKHKFLFVALVLGIAACKKDFTNRPSLDTATTDNYYNNAEQVRSATGTLYGQPWFSFQDKAFDCIGDVMAGNEHTYDAQYSSFMNFTSTATDPRLSEA